jgi:hypothetical protein
MLGLMASLWKFLAFSREVELLNTAVLLSAQSSAIEPRPDVAFRVTVRLRRMRGASRNPDLG